MECVGVFTESNKSIFLYSLQQYQSAMYLSIRKGIFSLISYIVKFLHIKTMFGTRPKC